MEDYIRTGYNSLERIENPMDRHAVGFILTTFQKLNASSLRAIKHALDGRLTRFNEKLTKLPRKRMRRAGRALSGRNR